MPTRLTDKGVRGLPTPSTGNRLTYDTDVRGFGVRVTAAGARAFVVNYRFASRERRYTIGSFPDWCTTAARDEARALKRRIDRGEDPLAEREAARVGQTVNDLADRFETEHLSKRRASTQADYKSIMRLYVRPELGRQKVANVRHSEIESLHARIAKSAPYRANRTVAVLSKMFALAVKWEMRPDNPARGIERANEERRERFLTPAEIARLSAALAIHPNHSSANAIRLLLLTGARRGEVLGATWDQFDLAASVWTKPSAATKQKKSHRIPLSGAALQLLADMKAEARGPSLFPGYGRNDTQGDLKRFWARICTQAGIAGARVHDLRHTHASILASSGLSLPIIGQLLGHTQPQTTARYAHLLDDPLRAAAERVSAAVSDARE